MNRAMAVIGALWGDEGKGLMVDYYASQMGPNAIVARFSGGANAGHTVVAPDGRRHVFSHFGAGTFVGCRTYLSQFFICNPFLWAEEISTLSRSGVVVPRLLIDSRAIVTTPYDMLINQAVEAARGDYRHGSCGIGINETVTRSGRERFRITVNDLHKPIDLIERLLLIRAEYVPVRMAELGLSSYDVGAFSSDILLNNFVAAATEFVGTSEVCAPGRLSDSVVIFEGSQGLLLDEVNGHFPHVTRARTGLTNVGAVADENGLGRVDVTYMSRSYMTRHGAGPFDTLPIQPFEDPTNAPNPWQGTMRFGCTDMQQLCSAISKDIAQNEPVVNSVTLGVTWLDKIGDQVRYKTIDGWREGDRQRFVHDIGAHVPAHRLLLSFNPSRTGVTEKKNRGVAA